MWIISHNHCQHPNLIFCIFSAFWKLVIIEIFLQFRWHFYQLLPLWCLLQPILERLSLSCHLLPLNCLIHSLCLCLCIYLCLCFCQCLCLDVFDVFDVYSSWSWNILIYWYGHLLPLNCLVQSFYLCLCLSGRLCIWCLWCLPQSWNIFIFLGISATELPHPFSDVRKISTAASFAYWLNLLQSNTSWDKGWKWSYINLLTTQKTFHPWSFVEWKYQRYA